MGMGIVSDADFDNELSKCGKTYEKSEPILVPKVEPLNTPGRKESDVNVPESLRKLIGQTAIEDGRSDALDLAKSLGISPSSVSAYAHGANSTASYNKPDQELKSSVDKSRTRVIKRARGKLMLALSHITDEKLVDAKPKDLAGIARDMSAVIKNMEPPSKENDNPVHNGPTFVLFAPKVNSEADYGITHSRD